MRGSRRFSQAISEGDGISLLADVRDADGAREAEADGAEGVVVRDWIEGMREATELPILWCRQSSLEDAHREGVDACLLVLEALEEADGRLEQLHADALALGLDCVVEVRNEDELQLALDRVDPEIFLLSARHAAERSGLEHVLGLLQDVPAGKLAVADPGLAESTAIRELERAGVDAVIVRSSDVAELVGGTPPEAHGP
jgi:indole-3-glycerol phosphate synthase